jgi:hypothetical protein
VEQIPHRDGTYSSSIHIDPRDLEEAANRLGKDGWELCDTGTGSILMFRRQIMLYDPMKAWQPDASDDEKGLA